MHVNKLGNNFVKVTKQAGSSTFRAQSNNFLRDLGYNELYHKRQASLSNKSSSKQNQNTKSIANNKFQRKASKKNSTSNICDKLLSCLRYLGIIKGDRHKKNQEAKDSQ